MKSLVLYIHGKGGSAAESEHYRPLFPDSQVIGLDYRGDTPWEAGAEIRETVMRLKEACSDITLVANSIGAYFSMCAGIGPMIRRAYFISPIVDMERLIREMMAQSGVTEAELTEKGIVTTPPGDALSWEYLCYAREHPAQWTVPTEILYGEYDALTSYETVSAFAQRCGAGLTVMKGGEHWFHTEEQMHFLDGWIAGQSVKYRRYSPSDYEAVCDFLIALSRGDNSHINWNWARFEWMMEHPEFDRASSSHIGLWWDREKVVGAAIYDMYFGEAFCGVLPEYGELYPLILDYAWQELRDDSGLGIAISAESHGETEAAKARGFVPTEQCETVMCLDMDKLPSARLPDGFSVAELDPEQEAAAFQWLLWQGFDHGTDRAEFAQKDPVVPQIRRHFNRHLSLTAVAPNGDRAAYCCLWFHPGTDYTYVEPVCTVPAYRGRGIAGALLTEALARAGALSAKTAYVISDLAFYRRLGFETMPLWSFYWKKTGPGSE